jgi:hypothetical protein
MGYNMKTFSVNKNAWHYELNVHMAKTNDRLKRDDYAERFVQSKDNFCSYWRMTLWSMFKVAVATAFLIGVAGFLMFVLYNIGYAFMFHTAQALVGAAVLIGAVALIAGTVLGLNWMDTHKKRKLDAILYNGETETSLAKAKYSTWKNGVCIPVEFK